MITELRLTLLILTLTANSQAQVNLKVGIISINDFVLDKDVGYKTSAGAMIVGLKKAIKDGIYNPALYNISFEVQHSQCQEHLAVGYASNMIKKNNVSAIFGPICSNAAEVVGALTAYKNIPLFLWTSVSAEFLKREKYPNVVSAAGTVIGFAIASGNIFQHFNWTTVGVVYTDVEIQDADHVPFCKYYSQAYQKSAFTSYVNISVYIKLAKQTSIAGFQSILASMNARARIIVVCLESMKERRNFMIAASLNRMVGHDYLYIIVQASADGFGQFPFWKSTDEFAPLLEESSKSILILDKYAEEAKNKEQIDKEIIANIKDWPFYQNDIPKDAKVSNMAFYLGDSFYVYLSLLNWTYTKYGPSQLTNATALLKNLIADRFTFPSIMGMNYTVFKGFRLTRYALYGLNIQNRPTIFGVVYTNKNDTGVLFAPNYTSENDSIWAIRGGNRPACTPVCGFGGICPLSTTFYIVISIGSMFLFVFVITSLCIIVYIYKKRERKRLNSLWQIPFTELKRSENEMNSARNINRSLLNTSNQNLQSARRNNEHTEYFYLDKEVVIAQKHYYSGKWSSADEEEFRKMRQIDNKNMNRFLRISISNNFAYFLWGYCERGNIIEVIKSNSFRFDATIILGMIREIVEGLYHIHNSSFGHHGNLSAYNCVVGDRFDVKIQCYGCSAIKKRTFRRLDNKYALYVAPELLQDRHNEIGSKSGDIYSLAVISSVIVTMKPAFGIEDAQEIEEVVRKVKSGIYPLFRPSLDTNFDIHPEILCIIKDCWSENPTDRPRIEEVREMLFKRSGGKKTTNLMDHMFSLMKDSASQLEKEVRMRTIELEEEQKKTDNLLYRIMPKVAADKLKKGEIVFPEVYESASVLFSDIVSFTVLASKSTPLEIINFLNNLWTIADSVIEKYDVHKIETIGDAMHVVSGIPNRNGNNHVKEIANMAIDFHRAVKTIRLSHLPDQLIEMRIGIHSGSCVAGIVGITNPHYIVLGDTVNISAKMEASGRAGCIHITEETRDLLLNNSPDKYMIVERGETLIKGIGVMNTHWLVPSEEINGFRA